MREILAEGFFKAWHADEVDAFEDILVRWLLLLGMVDLTFRTLAENF